jgi:hypothetical protein
MVGSHAPSRRHDDADIGAPSSLCFPHATYNMAVAACYLEDISDMPDPKTNEQLNEAKRLLRVALEQQAKSSASRHRVILSRLSQMTAAPNRDRSDAHAP